MLKYLCVPIPWAKPPPPTQRIFLIIAVRWDVLDYFDETSSAHHLLDSSDSKACAERLDIGQSGFKSKEMWEKEDDVTCPGLPRAIFHAWHRKAHPHRGWIRFHSETQGRQLSVQLQRMLPICKNGFNKDSIYHLFKACLLLLWYILLPQGAAFSYLPR